jgi:hypothetical protein
MESVGNPTRSPAGPPGSISKSSFWNNISKEMLIAIVSGVISTVIVSILWKCIKAMLNTNSVEQPDAAPLPNPPPADQEEIELESVLSSPQSSTPPSSPSDLSP